MSKTVVGLFNTMAEANRVKTALTSEGFAADQISVVANDDYENTGSTGGTATANDKDYTDIGSGGGTGVGEKISNFFRSLAGGDEKAHHHYASGVNTGGVLLAVTCEDDRASDVAAMLKQQGARDIDKTDDDDDDLGTSAPGYAATGAAAGAGAGYASTGDDFARTGTRADAFAGETGQTAIPIIEEELVVGKRQVDRGGVRIYSHVVENPVEADVTLHEERINVERRAVNRPATAADFAAGSGSVIELNATGEEAVVGKTSRVVEEVLVGKESSEHTQAIHDSVRRTEVEVENVEGETVEGSGVGTTRTTDRY